MGYFKKLSASLREAFAVAAFMMVANTALAQTFYVPSGSMEPTLAVGDAIIATKFPYGYSRYSVPFALGPASETRLLQKLPARGDVVVFRLPRDPGVTYVKRVIGLPGDRVAMRGGRLVLNGSELPLKSDGEGVAQDADGSARTVSRLIETLPGGVQHVVFKMRWDGPLDNTPDYVVPAGHVFMLGDNRDNSTDSRVSPVEGGVGFVPMENLVARAEFTIGSFDFLNATSPATWLDQIRWSRFFRRIG